MSSSLLIIALLFVVGYVLHGLLLAVVVWALEKLPSAIRLQSPAWRELLWRTVLLAPLCTVTLQMQSDWQPLMGVMTPGWFKATSVQPLPVFKTLEGQTDKTIINPTVNRAVKLQPAITEKYPVRPAVATPETLSELTPVFGDQSNSAWQSTGKMIATVLLFILWLSGTIFLLIRLARQRRQLWQLRQTAQPVFDQALQSSLQGLLNRNTRLHAPKLLHHPAIQGPATLPDRTICLPLWVDELSAERQQAMLAHELGHIQRGDVAWLHLTALLQALFWPQLLLPLVRERLMSLAEIQADSVARHLLSNNGLQLADCLTHCAERIHNHFKPGQYIPGLAVAMSHPNAQIPGKQSSGTLSERVRHLISIQPAFSEVSMSKKMTVMVGAMALALILPAVNVMAEKASHHQSIHVIDDDNGHTDMKLSIRGDDGRELKLKAKGNIQFTDDDTGIESMSKGDTFSLKETNAGVTRQLIAEGGENGGIDYQYSVDGDSQAFDNEAKAWLSKTLPDLLTESGINVEGRIAHLLSEDGHEGVIKRIHKIQGDHARGKHIEVYAGSGLLEDQELDDVLVEVKRIGSDYDQRNALVMIKEKQLDGNAGVEVDQAHIIKRKRLHKIVDASEGIDSDYEVRSLLDEISKDIDIDIDGAEVHRIVLHRAGEIDSDYELRQTLSGMADAAASDEQVAEVWLDTAAKLESDFELRQALEQLAHAGPEQQSTWVGMLKLAERFDSDYECATFLTTAANNMPRNSDTEAAYRAVLENIDSDYERDRARRALG